MEERIKQVKIYLIKFLSLFFKTGGWKLFIFGTAISLIIAFVVGDNMFENYKDTLSGCFSMVSACIWIGIFNSIQVICKERDIIKREHRSGLHISSYIIARAIYEMIICLVQAVIMVVLYTNIIDFPKDGLVTKIIVIDTFITFFVILLSSDYLGIAVSSIVKTANTAMTVMPFLLIIQLVFSGFVFELEGSVGNIAKITISKWGMEILGSISNGNGVLGEASEYLYKSGHVVGALFILLGFSILYLIVGIISLEFVDKDKR